VSGKAGKGEKSSSTKGKGSYGAGISNGKAGGKGNKTVSGKAGTMAGKGEKSSSTKGKGIYGAEISKGGAGGKGNKTVSGKAGTVAGKGEKNSSTKSKGQVESKGIRVIPVGPKLLGSAPGKNGTRTELSDESHKKDGVNVSKTKTKGAMKVNIFDMGTKTSKITGWNAVGSSNNSRTKVASSSIEQEKNSVIPEFYNVPKKGTQDSEGRDETMEKNPWLSSEGTSSQKNDHFSLQNEGENLDITTSKNSMHVSVRPEKENKVTGKRNYLRGQSTVAQARSPGIVRSNIFQRSSMIGGSASKNPTRSTRYGSG
jgi:hypothetical protein